MKSKTVKLLEGISDFITIRQIRPREDFFGKI